MTAPHLTPQLARELVQAAIQAPSIRGTQPWRFTAWAGQQLIAVHADPARMLRGADPRGRAVHISCGSALFNLRLAVSCAGAEPVTRLLPQPGDPQLLGTVRLTRPCRPPSRDQDLYRAIWARPAAPARPANRPVTAAVLAGLREAAAVEGAALFPVEQPGQPTPRLLAVLATGGDSRSDWLRAGQALQRILLLAACHGVGGGLLGQAAAFPHRAQNAGYGLGGQHIQLVLRLGSGAPGPVTQRRPVDDVLRIAATDQPGEADRLLAGLR
jgi:nitroreductase